jgi:hypothetical protein
MLVMLRVPLALLTATTTRIDARLEDRRQRGRAAAGEPGGNPPGCVAYVCAVEAQADALPQRRDVVFRKARVGAGGACLRTCETLLDAAYELVDVASGSGGVGAEHFLN